MILTSNLPSDVVNVRPKAAPRADARADRLAAAAIYQELSKLSDAELRDRGLSRATLAHDVRASIADRRGG